MEQIAWIFNRIWKLSPQDSLNLRACWFHGAQRSCSDNCTSFELSSWIFCIAIAIVLVFDFANVFIENTVKYGATSSPKMVSFLVHIFYSFPCRTNIFLKLWQIKIREAPFLKIWSFQMDIVILSVSQTFPQLHWKCDHRSSTNLLSQNDDPA